MASNERHCLSNHRHFDYLFNSSFRLSTNESLKVPHYWPFVRGNPPVIGGFPSQRASNAENGPMPCYHHVCRRPCLWCCTIYLQNKRGAYAGSCCDCSYRRISCRIKNTTHEQYLIMKNKIKKNPHLNCRYTLKIAWTGPCFVQGLLLLTWVNINPSVDK